NRNKFSGKNKQSSGDQSPSNHPQVTYINNAISGHRKRRSSVKWNRLLLLILMVLFGLGILSVGIFAISRMLQKSSDPTPTSTPIPTSAPSKVNDAPIPITKVPDKTESEGKLDESSAKEILENWLKIKAKSLGNDHNTDELSEILIDPALSIWRKNAKTYKESGQHWEYQHNVSIKSLKQDEKESNQGQVEAMVYEDGKLYDRFGNLITGESYQKDLFVRYDLERKDGKWFIRKMKVLN
ncbi:MAG TPA: ARC6/PARC6 family protein, partial [Allocoleopsis sp.]